MNRTFVIGDIHGAFRALVQCLERSGFDYEKDHLISLGDVCDGWPETKQAIDELRKVKSLTYILGNHDYWTLQWMRYGNTDEVWLKQGGAATIHSYDGVADPEHAAFLKAALPYFVLHEKLFVHAGILPKRPLEQQGYDVFLWDRSLANTALDYYYNAKSSRISSYDEIYIGHTPTTFGKPVHGGGVWLMDTGAGWSGVLSMMDVHSKEIYVSDPVPLLYPGVIGRTRNG